MYVISPTQSLEDYLLNEVYCNEGIFCEAMFYKISINIIFFNSYYDQE